MTTPNPASKSAAPRQVFVTGGTGYLGRRLIAVLLERGHAVRALVRPGSERKLPPGCTAVVGDALDNASFAAQIAPAHTLVHLVGVPHPAPWKGQQFHAVDLVSIQAAVTAAQAAGIRYFVYVSVAQPAPVMKAFIEVRAKGEALLRESGLNATVLRPWYVLGPSRWWPLLFVPAYWVLERLPATKQPAQRLGLVTIKQMTRALLWAVENPCEGIRMLGVSEIRRMGRGEA